MSNSQNNIQQQFKSLRARLLSEATLRASFVAAIALVLVHVVFYVLSGLFFGDWFAAPTLLISVGIALTFIIFPFFYYRDLLGKSWTQSIVERLPEELRHYEAKLRNGVDLLQKRELAELERAYLDDLNALLFSRFSLRISARLYGAGAAFVLAFFVLNASFSSFERFVDTIYFGAENNTEFYLELNASRIEASPDSTVTLTYSHNIPEIANLTLVLLDSGNSRRELFDLNYEKQTFTLKREGLLTGKIFLESNNQFVGLIRSDTATFRFISPFQIVEHSVQVTPPKYTGIAPFRVVNNSDISVPVGSRIRWETSLSNQAERALGATLAESKRAVLLEKRVYKNTRIGFSVADADSQKIAFSSEEIEVIQDKAPLLILNHPRGDISVSDAAPIQFFLSGVDDYGFSAVKIRYYTVDPDLGIKSDIVESTLLKRQGKVFQKQINWPINSLDVFPGMDIYYEFVGIDNNTVTKKQTSATPLQKIHLLSLAEIFAQMNKAQEEVEQSIAKNMNERKDILSKIDEYRMKLKQKGELSHTDKQELDKLFSKLDELNSEMKQTEQKLDELQKKAEKNDLFSEDLVDKFKELQDLIDALKIPKKESRKSATAMNSGELQKEIENITQTEEAMQQEIDRIKSLLGKLKQKQDRESEIRQLDEFRQNQEAITRLTKENESKSDRDQGNLASRVEKFANKSAEGTGQAQSRLKEQNIAKQMRQTNTAQNKEAERKQIADKLKQMQSELEQKHAQEEEESKKELLKRLNESLQKLLYLSFSQENLSKESAAVSIYSPKFRTFIRRQNAIREQSRFIISELSAISKESMLFNPKVLNTIALALEKTSAIIAALEQRENRTAVRDQKEVLGALNQSILMLHQQKNKMQQASSGLGDKEFMKQMSQMAEGQQGVNQQSESLWDQLKKQLSDKQLSGKERLSENGQQQQSQSSGSSGQSGKPQGRGEGQGQSGAGKNGRQGSGSTQGLGEAQQKLADQLSDLIDEMGEGGGKGGGTGRASAMLEEMRKIAGELAKNRLDKKLIERQKKLLQKMLDASSSGREKDKKTKRREKEDAKEFTIVDVKELDKSLGQDVFLLQQFYEDAMKEPYSDKVRLLIQHYFNNLIQLEVDTLSKPNL